MDPATLEYIAEGREILERVSRDLEAIGRTGSQSDTEALKSTLSSLYRDVHTLKGNSQLFGFRQMAQISHGLEASLDPVRKGIVVASPPLIEACARNINLLDQILRHIENTGSEPKENNDVIHGVSQLVEAATTEFNTIVRDESPMDDHRRPATLKSVPGNPTPSSMVTPERPAADASASTPSPVAKESIESPTIRVHVSLLDRILNLVGELVLAKNQIGEFRNRVEDSQFAQAIKSLDSVTGDLQSEIMKTRMQPIETMVGKFHRLVRDISKDLGKQIDLTVEGGETEIDKSLLEAIRDPLTHIVRNSCDHGIESPKDRKAAGKPETGHVLIRSFHEGGQVVVEISDDGKGISRKRVVQKAIDKGLLTAEKAAKLSDREICEIIFLPGFSTAEAVTAVSGRGVGMDVVKTNIEKIGGSVEIRSIEGKGTTLQLRIPLTLAIVPALIVKSFGQKFAIPQVKLVELVKVSDLSQEGAKIETLQGRPMYRLRGSLLPLYDLRELTGETFDRSYRDGAFIVVLNAGGEAFGLLVPEISDTADIVVKPLNSIVSQLGVFSGATILGDGSIALVLDVEDVAEFGHVLNKRAQDEEREVFSKAEKLKAFSDTQEFLLFSLGTDTTFSVPLCLVSRLEEFSFDRLERSGDQYLVQYRGGLLPLIGLKEELLAKKMESEQKPKASVIVIQRSGRNFGIWVDEIKDVVTIDGQIDDSIRDRAGILGNILFGEDVIVVIDALGIIEGFDHRLRGLSHAADAESDVQAPSTGAQNKIHQLKLIHEGRSMKAIRVLYAEDVAFFRRHVSKVLANAGMDVTTVEDGQKALEELAATKPGTYNLILSDIEMPRMNGLEFAKALRAREGFQKIPLIALTTRFRKKDIEEGKAAGFNGYLEKLNPEVLLAEIANLMGGEGLPKAMGEAG